MSTPSWSFRVLLTACLCATTKVVATALTAAPATASVVKATRSCSPGSVNASYPTPTAATNVSAASFGAVKGAEKVSWTSTVEIWPAGCSLYFQILTSNGQCTKPMSFSVNITCLCGKPQSTNYSCKIKRLRSGNTEFRVALWYQSGSGARR
ncbi:MAG: hypothetical protein WEA35_08760 [Candidatus Nanopelagicales bacterium]